MKRNLLAVAALALGAAVPAAPAEAVEFVLDITETPVEVTNDLGNDFLPALTGLGLTSFASSGVSLSLTGDGDVNFYYLGNESGFKNQFQAGSLTSDAYSGYNVGAGGQFLSPVLIGTISIAGGAITDWKFYGEGLAASLGTGGFGFFVPTSLTAPGTYQSGSLYLGYDDHGANPEDNHDDLIILAQAVPEPATWAMLLAGFVAVGAAMRRRGNGLRIRQAV